MQKVFFLSYIIIYYYIILNVDMVMEGRGTIYAKILFYVILNIDLGDIAFREILLNSFVITATRSSV